MKNYYYIILLALWISSPLSAQTPTAPTWTAVHNGSGDNSDRYNKIIPDGLGNFIGVGFTVKKGNYKDILVAKFDTLTGDTMWWRTKNGSGNADDEGMAVAVDAAGNVYVTGVVDAGNSGDNIITMKFDNAGVLQWDTTWNNNSAFLDDAGVDIKIDGAGFCIVGGNTEPDTFPGSTDFVILKYAPNGALVGENTWSRPGFNNKKDELAEIAIDGNDNIYAVGRSLGNTDDFGLVKVDSTGTSIPWAVFFSGVGEDRATCIAIDNAGFILIAGSSENSNGDLDFRTNKYNSAGLLQWTRGFTAPAQGDDKPTDIATDQNNDVIVTGYADVNSSGAIIENDFQTLKWLSTGANPQPIWVKRDGSGFAQNDEAAALFLDANGDVYVTGRSDQDPSPTFANYDYMSVAYSSSGSNLWGPNFHAGTRTGDDDEASTIVVYNSNVYVAGRAENLVTQKDATVIKYDQATGNGVWTKNHNGAGDFSDEANAIVVDQNSVTYAVGSIYEEGENMNAAIAKIDITGNILCTWQFSGIKGDDDEFKCVALSSNGIVYAAGYTKVQDQKRNYLLVKWDPAICDSSWARTYDFIGQSDRIESMILDNAGNIYVTGRSDANPGDTLDNEDIVTIKYDPNGTVQWTQRWDNPGVNGHKRDEPQKIMFDNLGNLVIGGRTEEVHDDFVVLKYDQAGVMQAGFPKIWNSNFGNDDRVTDVAIDAANNILLAGFSQTASGGSPPQNPSIQVYDAAGTWINQPFIYNGGRQDEIVKLDFDFNGNMYALLKYDTFTTVNDYNYKLIKFDPSLIQIWERIYDSPISGDDVPKDMVITPSGDVYVTGVSDDNIIGASINKNWVTLGYDSAGNRIFIANADGPNSTDDAPDALTIVGTTLWVGGYTEGLSNSQKNLTVISYDLILGLSDNSPVRVKSFAYPNPFSDNCRIEIGGNQSDLTFELIDMLGNKISDNVKVSGNVVNFERGNLAQGVYQYRIVSNTSIVSTGKLIIN